MIWRVGVEKLASKTRFPSGEFLPIRVFLLVVVAYALAIAGCALMLRNRTSRLHGGLVPKRDHGSYCIVLARCGRLALSSIIEQHNGVARRREHGGDRYD